MYDQKKSLEAMRKKAKTFFDKQRKEYVKKVEEVWDRKEEKRTARLNKKKQKKPVQ